MSATTVHDSCGEQGFSSDENEHLRPPLVVSLCQLFSPGQLQKHVRAMKHSEGRHVEWGGAGGGRGHPALGSRSAGRTVTGYVMQGCQVTNRAER